MIVIVGLLGNVLNGNQVGVAILEDVIANLKFPCAIGAFYMIFNGNELDCYNKAIIFHIRLITVILFSVMLLNRFVQIYPTLPERLFGIFYADYLFYFHPTYFAAAVSFLLCVSIAMLKFENLKWTLVMQAFMVMDTTRSKAMAWLAIAFFLLWLIVYNKGKLSVKKLVPVALIAAYIGKDKFIFHFVTLAGSSAQSALLLTSFKIAGDLFPIGTGFGTFGSAASGKQYSRVYIQYGINNVWGLSLEKNSFISDSLWPMILGQFGCVGLLLYIGFLVLIYLQIQKLYQIDKY